MFDGCIVSSHAWNILSLLSALTPKDGVIQRQAHSLSMCYLFLSRALLLHVRVETQG